MTDRLNDKGVLPVKRKMLHPLWVHLPAVLGFIALVICIVVYSPYPANAPVHFGTSGLPDRYGSPWEVIGITLGFSVFFIGLSVFLDELWAKQEKKKTFNWFTLLDEIVAGAMTGFTIDYMQFLSSGAADYQVSWWIAGLTGGVAAVLALLLELARPFRRHPEQIVSGESAALKTEIIEKLKSNSPFVYWDTQNPFFISLVTILLPVVMFVSAGFSWTSQIWVSILLIIVGLLMIIPNGGQRVIVTRRSLTLRWGLVGIKVLKLDTNKIAEVSLHGFSPLKDFGGYGIRFNREMKAYFLRGSLGVLVSTVNNEKYLIGSDQPEDLYTVLKTIVENR